MRMVKYLLGAVGVVLTFNAWADNYLVYQRNKAFSSTYLKVKVGDTVNFVNDDPFFHNVLSLSDVKSFDLGSYPRGQGRVVRFDKPGHVFIECAIHPFMKMKVEVKK